MQNDSGERQIENLLAGMEPVLHDDMMVFCSSAGPVPAPLLKSAIGTFREREGTTLILRREEAQAAGLDFSFPCRRITLNIHSSLDAIGFLAVITTLLAEHGISANPVSGYYHDHLFVPPDRAEEALALLRQAAREAARSDASTHANAALPEG